MTLEDYREVIAKLKACSGPSWARNLLAQVDLVLTNSGISAGTRRAFWEDLNHDLEVVGEESTLLLEKQAATVLSSAIAAAQTVIAQYHHPECRRLRAENPLFRLLELLG